MKEISWSEYHRLCSCEAPEFPHASQEYIYAYPVTWDYIDVAALWKPSQEVWHPKQHSIYVHFPFCREMCPFCTFCHVPWRKEVAAEYVNRLTQEAVIYSRHPSLTGVSIESVYFGGGTPCLIPPDSLETLITTLKAKFPISETAEISMECNPLDTSPELLQAYKEVGVNRLSFGVQSFSDHLCTTLGIRARRIAAQQAIESSVALGFNQVSVDLMYGIPGQTESDLLEDLDICIKLSCSAVSLYFLDVEGSPLEKMLTENVPLHIARNQYYAGRHHLLDAGFSQHTQPDFFKGAPCVFTDLAWRAPQGGNIGLGAGAISFLFNGYTYVNVNRVEDYIGLLSQHHLPVLGGCSVGKDQLMAKYPILGFRAIRVPTIEFDEIFGAPFDCVFGQQLNDLQQQKLINPEPHAYVLTEPGLWYVDNISRTFYEDSHEKIGQPWAKFLQRVAVP